MGTAIDIRNLSKRYMLGEGRAGYGRLSEALSGAFGRLFRRGSDAHQADVLWALKDVDLKVAEGEVLGLIGANGAGKSTLLKVLARITPPSAGSVRLTGRVGSLLEVGTGFHPELSGRENIYLNGAILGMPRREIQTKFDDIVAFSEMGRFLNTPVKRYSSGMYVRLAFAVAAHLEPEILLIDEVLAVGDAAFQKRCLGRVGEVARSGRTVVFVSHNMGVIRSLCDRGVLLEAGEVADDGPAGRVVDSYLKSVLAATDTQGRKVFERWDQPGPLELHDLTLRGEEGSVRASFDASEPVHLELRYQVHSRLQGARLNVRLVTTEGEVAFATTDHSSRGEIQPEGFYRSTCRIPGGLLNRREYVVAVGADVPGVTVLVPSAEAVRFTVGGAGNHGSSYAESWPGVVAPTVTWETAPADAETSTLEPN